MNRNQCLNADWCAESDALQTRIAQAERP